MLTYKVAETSDVTDTGLEKIINEHVHKGWQLDSMHFAMREASRRPAMVFVLFSRHEDGPPPAASDDDGMSGID